MKSANSYRLGSRQAFYTRYFAHTLSTHPARAPQVLSLLTRATREPPRHQNSGTARPLPRECARREEGTCRAQKERRCRFACAARCVRPQGMHQHGASLVCERATLRARFFGWRSRTGARAPFLVASRLAHRAGGLELAENYVVSSSSAAEERPLSRDGGFALKNAQVLAIVGGPDFAPSLAPRPRPRELLQSARRPPGSSVGPTGRGT